MPLNNAELIINGAQGIGKGLGAMHTEMEKDKPLTPVEQAIAAIMAGADPREEATKLKLQRAGHLPTQNPSAQGSFGLAGGGEAGVNMPSPSNLSPFRTQRDFQAAEKVAPFVNRLNVAGVNQAGQTARTEATLATKESEGEKNRTSKEGQTAQRVESQEKIAGAKLGQQGEQFKQKLAYWYDALKSKSENVRAQIEGAQQRVATLTGSDQRIAVVNQIREQLNSINKDIVELQTSRQQMIGDPDTVKMIDDKLKEATTARDSLAAGFQTLIKSYKLDGTVGAASPAYSPGSTTTTTSTSTTTKGGSSSAGPKTADDLLKQTRGGK